MNSYLKLSIMILIGSSIAMTVSQLQIDDMMDCKSIEDKKGFFEQCEKVSGLQKEGIFTLQIILLASVLLIVFGLYVRDYRKSKLQSFSSVSKN